MFPSLRLHLVDRGAETAFARFPFQPSPLFLPGVEIMKLTGTTSVDPWKHILYVLQRDCSSSSLERRANRESSRGQHTSQRAGEARRPARTALPYFPTCVTINVLDRTDRTATLAWHDPTSCHYDDQHWHRAAAQCNGVCAMTGALITRGTEVFRPSRRKNPAPCNAHAMILASALQALPLLDAAI
jgi:hypothetical protein